MLKCSTSLWSADLSNLAEAIRWSEPYSERFHLDVADGHYAPTMLFFPDLVKALRPHTRLPFEVHLMTTDPEMWIEPFADAGADVFIFCYDTVRDFSRLLQAVRKRGKQIGVSLQITEPVECLEPYWADLDIVTLIGTTIGTKGTSMDPAAEQRIRQAREIIRRRGIQTEIQADGGIRRNTVPLIHQAGADWIVPGSLMFKENPVEMRQWLATL
ncbi:MAG: ribulose-phosphate 3-epimerase [Pirellulaceae bacterium]